MTKTHFDKNLTSFNRKITSNKTKNLEVQKKLNSLIKNVTISSLAELILQVIMDFKTSLFINQHLIL